MIEKYASLPLPVAEQIDKTCDRFEADWKAGLNPRIEEFLDLESDPGRSILLIYLLMIEIELRNRDGVNPNIDHFRNRFPANIAHVEEAFNSYSGTETLNRRRCRADDTSVGKGASLKTSVAQHTLPSLSTPKRQRQSTAFGRFEVLNLEGEGSFGRVYRARDPQLERTVALKIPRRAVLDQDDNRERFFREAKIAAQLRHPNIVPVYDAGHVGNKYYIASAFVEGGTLDRVLKKRSFDFDESADIIRKLAEALHYAHSVSIVHRDVKPSNIMLDVRGEPQLTDFGLARLENTSEQLTQDGAIMGTPAYNVARTSQRMSSGSRHGDRSIQPGNGFVSIPLWSTALQR